MGDENNYITNAINEDLRETRKVSKVTRITGIVIIVLFILSLSLFLLVGRNYVSIEVEKFKDEIENGIEKLSEKVESVKIEVEKGNGENITLKKDAFKVIDDTEIILTDGLTNKEIEEALNNHKYGDEGKVDGDFNDQDTNIKRFNYLWGIEKGLVDIDFKDRLSYTHSQHIYRIDWNFFNQRSTPKIGNTICVPSSATFLLNVLGLDKIKVMDIIDFFSKSDKIKEYARKTFPEWIEDYIKENKLYQITGIFSYGLNVFLDELYNKFDYRIDYGYWSLDQIAGYVETFGLMSATFLPSFAMYGTREGGHMIVISKVYRDFDGNIIAFGINDPFGNPNVAYRGARGWDGKNVIISLDDMLKVMKSYYDDHSRGSKYLYRVLYFKDK